MISELPLFLFTTLAGLCAGFCATRAVFPPEHKGSKMWLPALIALILLAAGLVCVLFHLGRPERAMNGLANPSAGITREGYTAIVLGILLLIEFIIALRKNHTVKGLTIATGIVGLVFAFVMGFAYVNNWGIPVWTSPSTVALFAVGDVFMGAALVPLFKSNLYSKREFVITMVVLQVLALITFVWEATAFASEGLGTGSFIASIVLTVAAFVFTLVARKNTRMAMNVLVFACVIVAVAVARAAFYSACVI